MSSNGLASGNHLLEAISHGLCEVVERDATTLWHLRGEGARRGPGWTWHGGRPGLPRGARRATSGPAWSGRLGDDHRRRPPRLPLQHRRARAGPAAAPVPHGGWAATPRASVALLRALTEAAQSRLTLISGARDDVGACATSCSGRQRRRALRAELSVRERPRAPLPGRARPSRRATFDEDVAWELERLARRASSRWWWWT